MLQMKSRSVFFKIPILSLLFFYNSISYAQTLPAFSILQTNGKTLNTAKLPHTKPVLLIYFSPDCEHCTTLLNSMFAQIDKFKKATILLVSFRPISEIADFEKKYKTAANSNIIVGMEQPIFFLQKLYQLQSTPYTALFDRNGKLVYEYKKETLVDDLAMRLKQTR